MVTNGTEREKQDRVRSKTRHGFDIGECVAKTQRKLEFPNTFWHMYIRKHTVNQHT